MGKNPKHQCHKSKIEMQMLEMRLKDTKFITLWLDLGFVEKFPVEKEIRFTNLSSVIPSPNQRSKQNVNISTERRVTGYPRLIEHVEDLKANQSLRPRLLQRLRFFSQHHRWNQVSCAYMSQMRNLILFQQTPQQCPLLPPYLGALQLPP